MAFRTAFCRSLGCNRNPADNCLYLHHYTNAPDHQLSKALHLYICHNATTANHWLPSHALPTPCAFSRSIKHLQYKENKYVFLFIYFRHFLPMVERWPSSPMFTDCVVPLREDWAIFCHAGSGRVGRGWSARKKSLEILLHGRELNPGHEEGRQWNNWAELSYVYNHNNACMYGIYCLPQCNNTHA